MTNDRAMLLADVAEKYFIDGKTQTEIAKEFGVDRSMISRMLTEARKKGIIRIQINRSIARNYTYEEEIRKRFGLKEIYVVSCPPDSSNEITLDRMGNVGAYFLNKILQNMEQFTIGTTWGTSVFALVKQLEFFQTFPDSNVVQLVGALGADYQYYDGHSIVQDLAKALGAKAYHLNAPFILDSPETTSKLMTNTSIQDVMELALTCDVALVGVGSVNLDVSSFYHAGHVNQEDLEWLGKNGAVGDVCGLHFDVNGNPRGLDFQMRLTTLSKETLLQIPLRFAISGGDGKAEAILGAIRGEYINALVTDENTAKEILNISM